MARGDYYRCSKCGYRFVSHQQEDALGPVGGCENCGSTRIHRSMGRLECLGCLVGIALLVSAIAAVVYWLFW